MENKKTTVSIGLPVYNGEKYIRKAIDSALTQTFTDFELIISDNGSTDKTEEICREYAKNDSRIRYIRQPENRGIHFNSNFVLQEAQGIYFTWLCHDDIMTERFLEEAVDYLSKHNNCFAATGDFEVIDEFDKTKVVIKLEEIRENINWHRRLREFFKCPMINVYYAFYGLYRTEKIKAVFKNIPHPKMLSGSEYPILSRFATVGEIVSLPFILRKHRQHSQSSVRTEKAHIDAKSTLERLVINTFNIYRIRFDQAKILINSNYSFTVKIVTIIIVHLGYLKSFIGNTIRSAKKIICSIKK